MEMLPDASVALVVTSPPYFAGKQYEQELDRDGVPSSYLEYLELLRDVFAECKRVLEPGGRIAVNVANLGRKPYRSLSADVIRILQDDLRLLLRGEVIWKKADGASGSCAWGSFRSATNPVLRDTTERVVIASKGRFDRARSGAQRAAEGLPSENEITADEFMEATLDVWNIAPERARRVNHPAPFPVELPERLIGLYTYENDLVLDPFMGSGTTLVAAIRSGRRYTGYDTDRTYVDLANRRVKEELKARAGPSVVRDPGLRQQDHRTRAAKKGKTAQAIAGGVLEDVGFRILVENARLPKHGMVVSFIAADADGVRWYFDVSGAFTATRGGLLRTDAILKSLGRASILAARGESPVVLLTSHLPAPRSAGDLALRAAGSRAFFDAVEMLATDGQARLGVYARGGRHTQAIPGFWTEGELARL
jgi:site-specific DNA-methyltransferase (adenine-specific)